MYTVDFKFSEDQQVSTVFGEKGIVTVQSFTPKNGNEYFVQTGDDKTSKWYRENQLTPGWE